MTTFTVSSQAQLDSALTQLKSGDTLKLAGGTYSLVMSAKPFTSNVTVTSLDPANPARLSWLKVSDVSNITFKNLDIGRSLTSTESTETALSKLWGGSNITFDSVHFYGSMDNNPLNDGIGIIIGGANGIKIVNSEFEQLGRGAQFGASNNVTVANNKFHDIRTDGIDFSAVTNVLIDGNSFTNFNRTTGDHPDAIQFWTTNTTTPSTDIVIRNNVIMQGSGDGMQGIFMGNELGIPYERVTIQNNLIYEQNMPNGIMVSNGKDITITGNTVLSPAADGANVWIRAYNVVGGLVTKNVTDRLNMGTNTSFTVTDNLLVGQSGLSPSVLALSAMSSLTVSALLVSGYGYTPPSTTANSGGTTIAGITTSGGTADNGGTTIVDTTATTTKPGKAKRRKGMLSTKTSLDSVSYSSSSFSVQTLSDMLPEMQSSYGTIDTGSFYTTPSSTSASLFKAQKKAAKVPAELFTTSTTAMGIDLRQSLFYRR